MPKLLAGFLVGGAIIVGAWWYLAAPGAQSQPEAPAAAAADRTAENAATAGVFNGSFDDLAARGGNWKCTFTTQTEMGAAQGEVYVSGDRIRGNFSMTAPVVGKVESYMIADDEYTYSWSSVLPQGFKARRADTGAPDGATKAADTGIDPRMQMSYECEPHTAAADLFVVPTNVTFQTLN